MATDLVGGFTDWSYPPAVTLPHLLRGGRDGNVAHRLPDLPAVRSNLRARADDRGRPGDGLERRRGRRLQPRLPLPEGDGREVPARGPGPDSPPAGANGERLRGGVLGR